MKRRKNNEGSYGNKTIKGVTYKYYRDPLGKYTYARTSKELEKKLKESKEEIKAEQDNTYIFSDYCYVWLRSRKSDLSQTTYDSYEDIIRTRITNSNIGNKAIRSLNANMFTKYYSKLGEKYSRGTIDKTTRIINPVLKLGMKKGLIPKFDTSEIKIPKESQVAVKKKIINFISLDEIEKIYNEANRLNKRKTRIYGNASQIIIFIMYSGLRIGEALGLTWEDVKNDFSEITVKHARAKVAVRDDNGELILKNGKKTYVGIQKDPKTDAGYRTIPLPDRAIEVLNYFNEQFPKHKKTDNIFLNSNNKPYDKRNVQRCLEKIIINSGIDKVITPHSLRHGYGSILISKGIDIKIVSVLLGHSDITTTYNIYVGVFKEDQINAVKNVFNTK